MDDHRFPCDRCGSDMRFDPAGGKLLCDYCGNETLLENAVAPPLAEMDYETALRAALPSSQIEEIGVSPCPNCGALIEFAADSHATTCPFCATPVVAGTGAHRQIKPRGVLPFALSEREAHGAMTDWLGSLWFAPNGLSRYARKGRRLSGVYVPFWTFDAQTRSSYEGERGTVHVEHRTVMRDGRPERVPVQKVRWRRVRGRVARAFDDVLVLASRSIPRAHADALAPWDLTQLVPYTPGYLAGFDAEGYQVDLEEGFAAAREVMDRAIARDVRFDIGGDRQRVHAIRTEVSAVTFKHVLLPVWMAAYRYRGASYRFVVNAQTGRVQGERPYSAIKIALAVLLALVLAGGAAYVYQMQ
ncbi:TFIIB-type zinc finger domain-containing protein [Profundibacterium mesophilum]|uniref:Primosomal protein N' (Replication factor Y)-superfamily II helicase n=1 Tax=Profundibacterium mesophilum KAUST100406-0324 TaxID=1037889 RepID=A0A921TCP0_9RHOB|nr:TFIIB-type zinc finger domain-containing protein [Profundibacterium mesophilum]KAF0675376.1 putative uncharacterized protein ydjG [Profundibacterium mesophilum KAUST100406-0324]